MSKKVNPLVLDASLNYIIQHCTHIVACSDEPSNYLETLENGNCHLASTTIHREDFSIVPGNENGRKLTIKPKNVFVSRAGEANHAALVDSVSATLLYVTTTTPMQLLVKDNLTLGEWYIEITDPA